MSRFDDALGHGAEGSTYRAPVPRKRTLRDRTKAWLWYRWNIGHRPSPQFERDHPPSSRRRRGRG